MTIYPNSRLYGNCNLPKNQQAGEKGRIESEDGTLSG
jgi:hypothetical protein